MRLHSIRQILALLLMVTATKLVYAQCGTTNLNNDLIISTSTTMSGTYNINGDFRIQPGVTVSIAASCGELIINANNIIVSGDIIGDGVGPRGGSGGLGGLDSDCRGTRAAQGGNGGGLGFGPGRGGAGGRGNDGGHAIGQCGIGSCANGISGGAGGGGGGGGAAYGGPAGAGGRGNWGRTMGPNSVIGISINTSVDGGSGGPAGAKGNPYGTDTGIDIAQGSGGGGAGGGGGGYQSGTQGNSGGSGGGMVTLNAATDITVTGTISVDGAPGLRGGNGSSPSDNGTYDCTAQDYDNCVECIGLAYCLDAGGGGGGGGGGGSGGGIKIQGGGNVVVTASLSSRGGNGGLAGLPDPTSNPCYGSSAAGGGGGSGGRIKVFYRTGPCFSHNIAPIQSTARGIGGTTYNSLDNGYSAGSGVYRVIVSGTAPALNGGTILTPSFIATCGSADPDIIGNGASASGGSGNITYQWQQSSDSLAWIDISGATSATYNPPLIITKTYYRRMAFSGGCNEPSNVIVIDVPNDLSGFTIPIKPLCFGTSTGKAVAVVFGGLQPYTYTWSTNPVQTTDTAVGLATGLYFVTVNDNSGCVITLLAIVDDPPQLFATITNELTDCFGSATGSATVNPLGGKPPYTYNWSSTPAQTTVTATNLSAGSYTVTVTDANSCTFTVSTRVEDPPQLFATIDPTHTSCSGAADGSAIVNPLGGLPPYSFSWNTSPAQTGTSAVGLSAGNYTVTMTDASGCTITKSVTIEEPLAVVITLESNEQISCFEGTDGKIDITTTGGTPPYFYTWSNGSTGEDLVDVPSGTYYVTATDIRGCTGTFTNTLTQPFIPVVADLTYQDVSCYGGNDGSINISSITGGTDPYSFLWDDFDTTSDRTGLYAGYYTVIVKDSIGCETIVSAEVNEPEEILVELSSDDADNTVVYGYPLTLSAEIDPTGIYIYNWTPGVNMDDSTVASPIATTLESTTYELEVTNEDGCTATAEIDIDVIIPRNYGIPNAFSPNGDGQNDFFFELKQLNFVVTKMQIFDRWGELVYEGSDPWDGTMSGEPVQDGVYVYIIDILGVIEDQEFREIGSVALLR